MCYWDWLHFNINIIFCSGGFVSLLYVISGEEVGMELVLSRGDVHIADFNFRGNRHASGHELSPTLKEMAAEYEY